MAGFTNGKPNKTPDSERAKHPSRSGRSRKSSTPTARVEDIEAMHLIIEALHAGAAASLDSVDDYDEQAEAHENTEDLIKHYVEVDRVDVASTLSMIGAIQMLHDAIHDLMQFGKGVDGIEDKAIRDMTYAWFESDEFQEKYEDLLKLVDIETLAARTGVKQ